MSIADTVEALRNQAGNQTNPNREIQRMKTQSQPIPKNIQEAITRGPEMGPAAANPIAMKQLQTVFMSPDYLAMEMEKAYHISMAETAASDPCVTYDERHSKAWTAAAKRALGMLQIPYDRPPY